MRLKTLEVGEDGTLEVVAGVELTGVDSVGEDVVVDEAGVEVAVEVVALLIDGSELAWETGVKSPQIALAAAGKSMKGFRFF
jgi:hypothetical protein